jgi:hypothetical protein
MSIYVTVDPEKQVKHLNKKFWEELISYFLLIRHGPHRKWRVLQFYCCICIRCGGNVFTEPLRSNDRGIHIQTHRMRRGGLWSTSLRVCSINLYKKELAAINFYYKSFLLALNVGKLSLYYGSPAILSYPHPNVSGSHSYNIHLNSTL